MRIPGLLIFGIVLALGAAQWGFAAPGLSTDGRFISFSVQNDSYAQVLDTFRQQTGLEFDIPPELRNQRIPLVEIKGLTLRSALVKILEGSNFDYILISFPDDAEKVRKLIVTGRSVQTASPTGPSPASAAAMVPRRVNRQMAEDPFGGGSDMGFDEGSGNEPMVVAPVAENPPAQGAGAPQPMPAAGSPQQVQPVQTQPIQSAPGLQQQQIGQPLPPMTPQQVMPGSNQQSPQGNNNPSNRRTPF